ncbi:hypothetical protein BC831DRAFT_455031 [Entophlyctis helioformis]|nr:hypothetical protein BC831DRAFT_455031 [Entophlyctis helioformis]
MPGKHSKLSKPLMGSDTSLDRHFQEFTYTNYQVLGEYNRDVSAMMGDKPPPLQLDEVPSRSAGAKSAAPLGILTASAVSGSSAALQSTTSVSRQSSARSPVRKGFFAGLGFSKEHGPASLSSSSSSSSASGMTVSLTAVPTSAAPPAAAAAGRVEVEANIPDASNG